jgi:thioredoxin-related protein
MLFRARIGSSNNPDKLILMKTTVPVLAVTLSLLTGSVALAAKPGWTENFAEAQTKATAENRHVLLDFTGSDWCGWCIKLDKEVFAKPEFKAFGDKNLILVELDFPHGKQLAPKVKAQNDELGRKYKVNGYPTLVLLDPAGKEVKRWEGFKPTFFEDLKTAVRAK